MHVNSSSHKYYTVSTVKHNSCTFYYYVKMFLQEMETRIKEIHLS
jgi:hypothetical protein